MITDTELCLAILSEARPLGSAVPVIAFPGDPYSVDKSAWHSSAWIYGANTLSPSNNLFVGVSAFTAGDGKTIRPNSFFSRKKENFSALQAVMIDDVGNGPGSKLPMSSVKLDPTWMVETSPDNYQAWYVLADPCTDRAAAEHFIDMLVSHGLNAKNDPGMRGVSRVGRLPGGVNGKAKYAGFVTRLVDIDEGARFSLPQIASAYGMSMSAARNTEYNATTLPVGLNAVTPTCELIPRLLNLKGMVLGATNKDGWTPVLCPWADTHTGGDISGTGYSLPSEKNNHAGGFQCHHGHCQDRTISNVIAWADAEIHRLEALRR